MGSASHHYALWTTLQALASCTSLGVCTSFPTLTPSFPLQLMQASLNSTAVGQYKPLQSLESKLLLRKLLEMKDSMEYKGHFAVCASYSYSICVCP